MFDRLFVDPSEKTLVIALEEAGRSVGLQTVSSDSRYWWPLFDRVTNNAAGRSQLAHMFPEHNDKRYLAIAWWTDHQERRHVRICGGDAQDGRHPHYSRLDEDTRPPLWHVYPQYIYRVHRAGAKPAWIASCPCSATGLPQALAWMGPCCGPCHDRLQDGEALAGALQATVLDQQSGPICSLAFSPDGNTLAVSSSSRDLYLHDVRDGSSEWLFSSSTDYSEEEELRPLLFSPNGRFLAVGERDVWSVRVWVLGQSDDYSEELFTNNSQVDALAFSPDGRQLAAITQGHELFVWRHLGGEWHDQEYSQNEGIASVDFSPDGQTLALGGTSGTVILRDLVTWTETRRLTTGAENDEEVLFIHYTSDGLSLVLITGSTEAEHWRNSLQLRLWILENQREECAADIPIISALALSPDGRFLAWIVHDDQHSPAEVTFWDLGAWHEAGRLEWNTEDDLRELAFSPDGETLAIGTQSGIVKLVPWRLLLEA